MQKTLANLPIIRDLGKNTPSARILQVIIKLSIALLALVELWHLIDYYVPILWDNFIDLVQWLSAQNGILVSFACFGFLCAVTIITVGITAVRIHHKQERHH